MNGLFNSLPIDESDEANTMSDRNVHFSSSKDLWYTPQKFFDTMDDRHSFTIDVCATADNAKCDKFFTKEDNALAQKWEGRCWMNPPYGRGIGAWISKAYQESLEDYCEIVVCLIPSRTDTAWWHDYVMKGDIEFIRGRLKFGESINSAPFPSAIVVFK